MISSLWPVLRLWVFGNADSQAGSGNKKTAEVRKVAFRLKHGDLEIGVLSHEDEKWTFRYSEAFRLRDDRRPLVQFPDTSKVYESPDLWPFFGLRIPSLKQPLVSKIVTDEHIDTSDGVDLLRRFGRRTISNPFELVESPTLSS